MTYPARREPSLVGPGQFMFLNEAGDLLEVGWDGPEREKLWRYNQHYFDDLNARDFEVRGDWHRQLLQDWIKNNPPAQGTGWEPYPVSLRVVNWVKWALAGNELPSECLHCLAVQARWLMRRLEIHLLGNHLFANAKALVFAGLYFDGAEAEHWLRMGLRILEREVAEQVLPDGGHFERSTMYHALALEDMLDLCNIAACYPAAFSDRSHSPLKAWRHRVPDMWRWLLAMSHPDGGIGFFNDAALGIAPSLHELDAYAVRLGFAPLAPPEFGLLRLPDSGYFRLAAGPAVALLDVAPVGPDYLPGHAHADTLSFELSLFEQPLLVNSGTSCYGMSSERLRQRGTAAHNTVVVDGQDSTEVWGGFRVARRARPKGLSFESNELGQLDVRCGHNGYCRLPGSPMHVRHWRLDDHGLVVEDKVAGRFGVAEARYHFHPQVRLIAQPDKTCGEMSLPDGQFIRWGVEAGEAHIESSTYHPRFGVSIPNVCLVVRLQAGHSRLRLSWA